MLKGSADGSAVAPSRQVRRRVRGNSPLERLTSAHHDAPPPRSAPRTARVKVHAQVGQMLTLFMTD
jgi:hypothetical protein